MPENKKVEVAVVDWKDERGKTVCLTLHELDSMVLLSADAARHMAFCLMECADHVEPPFQADVTDDI